MQVDTDAALAFVVDTARAAGDVILQHDGLRPLNQRGRAARMKGPRDPVTDADLASERLIVGRLRERFPGTAIVAEEETRDRDIAGLTWYVDPLDGTVNFSQAHPFFAVSIALYRDAEPLVGVIHAPRLRATFAARAGGGATLNGETLAVSGATQLSDALLGTGFAYRRNELADDNVPLRRLHPARARPAARRLGALDLPTWRPGVWTASGSRTCTPGTWPPAPAGARGGRAGDGHGGRAGLAVRPLDPRGAPRPARRDGGRAGGRSALG
jgi:myo-inositol-1(or 4)-monophosphatase